MKSVWDKLADTLNRPRESSNVYYEEVFDHKWRHLIGFFCKCKMFVARRKFREAIRPYDTRDIIEHYSAGHTDMLDRVKAMQAK